jgi:Polyketide cyclase / dehydrase and lipid transport
MVRTAIVRRREGAYRIRPPRDTLDPAAGRPLSSAPTVSDYSQSYSVEIAGTLEDCFAVLIDFEAYPSWSGPVTECRVLERHPDGTAKRVSFSLDMTVKTIRYTLDYDYEPPRGGRWHLVESPDVKDVHGSYVFEPAGKRVKATCTQTIEIGFWVPGFIKGPLEQKALRDSVEEFKKAVEARARKASRA